MTLIVVLVLAVVLRLVLAWLVALGLAWCWARWRCCVRGCLCDTVCSRRAVRNAAPGTRGCSPIGCDQWVVKRCFCGSDRYGASHLKVGGHQYTQACHFGRIAKWLDGADMLGKANVVRAPVCYFNT